MKKNKIVFVISSLKGSGAERVVSLMANYWVKKGHDVTITTLAGPEEEIFYPLLPAVKLLPLDIMGKSVDVFADNKERIKKIRRSFKTQKPGIIISFMETTNILVVLAALGLKIPVIVSDRSDPKFYYYGRTWRCLRNITYPLSSAFVVQTKAVLEYYPYILKRKAVVIPNPVNIQLPQTKETTQKNIVCAMGRLDEYKYFDLLVHAFAKIAQKYPDWTLKIWGEGPERENLEALRDNLDLSERIFFPGFSSEPEKEMMHSGLFVMSSRSEGFPNVLVEAMACGLPVITTDCPCGPSEIVTQGTDGVLVPVGDAGVLARTMEKLIQDGPERKRLAQNAQKSVKRFYIDNIMKKWEKLIQDKAL